MSKYIGIFVFVFSLFSLGVHAGESFRFRVYLKDKGDSGYTLDNPTEPARYIGVGIGFADRSSLSGYLVRQWRKTGAGEQMVLYGRGVQSG